MLQPLSCAFRCLDWVKLLFFFFNIRRIFTPLLPHHCTKPFRHIGSQLSLSLNSDLRLWWSSCNRREMYLMLEVFLLHLQRSLSVVRLKECHNENRNIYKKKNNKYAHLYLPCKDNNRPLKSQTTDSWLVGSKRKMAAIGGESSVVNKWQWTCVKSGPIIGL